MTLLPINLSLSKSPMLVVLLLCRESPRIMASFGQSPNRTRDAFQSIAARLYKFALVLTVNEELARALLRSTLRGLRLRGGSPGEDRDQLIAAFRRMYALWAAKLGEDPAIQKKCPPDPRLFAASLKGPQLAKFMASMSSSQRGALYLVYGEGASYDEAAEAAGLDMLSLMKQLARGHVALSQWLDHREHERHASPGRERAA